MQWVATVHQKKLLMVLFTTNQSNKNNFYKIFGDKNKISPIDRNKIKKNL